MRKVIVLAAMLAVMLALAAPAFAQDVTVETGDDFSYNAVCQNLIGPVGDVTGVQVGDADAVADGGSVAVAHAHQAQNVSLGQGNVCLNNWGGPWGFLLDWLWWL